MVQFSLGLRKFFSIPNGALSFMHLIADDGIKKTKQQHYTLPLHMYEAPSSSQMEFRNINKMKLTNSIKIKQLNKHEVNNNFVNVHGLSMYYSQTQKYSKPVFTFLYLLICDVIHDLYSYRHKGLYPQLVPTLALCGILVKLQSVKLLFLCNLNANLSIP